MADIFTNIRELGVIFGIITHKKTIDFNKEYFFKILISHSIIKLDYQYIKELDLKNQKQEKTLKNALLLSQKILESKLVQNDSKNNIEWLGGVKSEKPYDVSIDRINFSLKENSFILNNMGLYKMLNIFLRQEKYVRGLNAFETFAYNELCDWFLYVRNMIMRIENKKWTCTERNKIYNIQVIGKDIILENNNETKYVNNFADYQYDNHKKIPTIFRKIISVYIRKNLQKDNEYNRLKKICSETAGKKICTIIKKADFNNPQILSDLFRFYETEEYYFAKTDNNNTQIYRVPKIKKISNNIQVKSVEYSVPKSQLNRGWHR